ncbi:MAG: hypothetical protein M1830_006634 [Pleopsidium flavum]|nr:MAG: hypothetical protein M1830_006634 [Pleopsidium flavum]
MNYTTIVRALILVSDDLFDIATQTQEKITFAQADEAHRQLNSILRQLILAARIGVLESTAEIFFRLVDEKEGGDETKPVYKELRATRLQLRFAQDSITVIQFFLDKEKGHYAKDQTLRSLATSASIDDFTRLSTVVRQLGFGAPSGLQSDG